MIIEIAGVLLLWYAFALWLFGGTDESDVVPFSQRVEEFKRHATFGSQEIVKTSIYPSKPDKTTASGSHEEHRVIRKKKR
jgi:hypothetical protein